MHARASQPGGNRIWLFSGTGEGPPLARTLVQRGWRLRIWVVSAAAVRAYPPMEGLELVVGALGGAPAFSQALAAAAAAGRSPTWVVDATHPFAQRISADLLQACRLHGQPLLRLQRPLLPAGRATLLAGLEELGRLPLAGRSLLLAIGARQLPTAIAHSPGARHHARILPSATALAQAMAAGLAPERVACLRPTAQGWVERALCQRWGIETVLCRQSGGAGEQLWQGLAEACGLQLLLLQRPAGPGDSQGLEGPELLRRLGQPEWNQPPTSGR
jgi:precorrin-6A/cobalt-precorrin-6A reductase